jgi:hypothetical protein
MKAFAQIDDDMMVANVIAINDGDAPTEADGLAYIAACGLKGTYVETFEDGTRGKYAAIGDLWTGTEFVKPLVP